MTSDDTRELPDDGAKARRAIARMTTSDIVPDEVVAPAPAPARWEELEELGRGLAVVRRARDRATGREVALKKLADVDATLLARLVREAEAATRLDHPSLVKLVDAGIDQGAFFVAYELIPGKTLEELAPIDEGRALSIALDVARALAHAHERAVIHRDVTPRNVIVRPDGRAVLADLGFAKDLLSHEVLTRTGDLLGTPPYLAPEGWKPRGAARLDERADVYGLGATLRFALTGKPPYAGASLPEIAAAVAAGPPSSMDVGSAATRALVERAMAREPRARFASADAMASAIEEAREGAPAPPQPPTPEPPKPRARWVWIAAGVLLVGGAIGLGVGLRARARATEARRLIEEAYGSCHTDWPSVHRAADRALELSPRSDDARILRAWAEVEEGDLEAAEADLKLARRLGDTSLSAVGRLAHRRGESVLWFSPWPGPHEALTRGRAALDVGDLETGLSQLEDCVRHDVTRGEPALEAHVLRALIRTLELDDVGAREDLAAALDGPPRDAANARAMQARIGAIVAGTNLAPASAPIAQVDVVLARFEREKARLELERHRLLGRVGDLDRTQCRLRRAYAANPDDRIARSLLLRALTRSAKREEKAMRDLAAKILADDHSIAAERIEAARALFALGQSAAAREALKTLPSDLGPTCQRRATMLRAAILRDGAIALKLWPEIETKRELAPFALDAATALALDRPSDAEPALAFIAERGGGLRLLIDLACARAKKDPSETIRALARASSAEPELLYRWSPELTVDCGLATPDVGFARHDDLVEGNLLLASRKDAGRILAQDPSLDVDLER